MTDSDVLKKAKEIIQKFLSFLKMDAEVKTTIEVDEEDGKYINVALSGEDLGSLIGYRGRTLNSLQLIFVQILIKEIQEPYSILLDINDYRQRRKEYLKTLAHRAAQESMESGQDTELPPLSSFERRVIHMELKNHEEVETESEGEREDRHIIVKIKKKK